MSLGTSVDNIRCKHCRSRRLTKKGIEYTVPRQQRYLCKACGKYTLKVIDESNLAEQSNEA